jgi:hypothetical protein
MQCLLIQEGENMVEGEWQNFYAQIDGFDYEPGFIYKLRVEFSSDAGLFVKLT